jgi:hypothetical protein
MNFDRFIIELLRCRQPAGTMRFVAVTMAVAAALSAAADFLQVLRG